MYRTNLKSKGGRNVREVISKVIPGIITAMLIGMWGTFGQVRDNAAEIESIGKELKSMEAKHTRRLDNLEHSRETMPDYYVTRREFNVIVSALDEKMNKVDKNVEKLLDLQMKKE